MVKVSFKGVVSSGNEDIAGWHAEDEDGNIINVDFLDIIDRFLEASDYEPTAKGEEVEIIIKVNRKEV